MSKATLAQCDMILADLRKGKRMTPDNARREYGCLRLAARIYDLRMAGYQIATAWERSANKRWARYVLVGEERQSG